MVASKEAFLRGDYGLARVTANTEALRGSSEFRRKIDCRKDLSTEPERGLQWSSESCRRKHLTRGRGF